MTTQPRHPLGTNARVLLTSVFGPYAQDDEYGSRKINPMELYQNQVIFVFSSARVPKTGLLDSSGAIL